MGRELLRGRGSKLPGNDGPIKGGKFVEAYNRRDFNTNGHKE